MCGIGRMPQNNSTCVVPKMCINISFLLLSAVFNALVLFCIRDIYGALQRMLNLKPEKDQKKYEVDVTFLKLLPLIVVI